jgi:glutamate-1-semialdehyde 2,1-aminomutase
LFIDEDVRDYRASTRADGAKNAVYNDVLRAEGIFKAPGKLYPSLAVTEADIAQTRAAVAKAVAAIAP